VTAKTGPIIAVHTLNPDTHEILLISNGGQTIRVGLKDVPILGRTTQGVRIMRVRDGDKVSSIGQMPENNNNEEGA
jgi:DNA gyrase subunit A